MFDTCMKHIEELLETCTVRDLWEIATYLLETYQRWSETSYKHTRYIKLHWKNMADTFMKHVIN